MERYMVKAKHKETGEWFIGFPMRIQNKHMLLLDDEQNLLRVYYTEDKMWDAETYAVEIDEKTICRPTGLTDINSNKIWENDFIKHYNNPNSPNSYDLGVVLWDTTTLRFKRTSTQCRDYVSISNEYDYEVISNKIDNPELLEKSNIGRAD